MCTCSRRLWRWLSNVPEYISQFCGSSAAFSSRSHVTGEKAGAAAFCVRGLPLGRRRSGRHGAGNGEREDECEALRHQLSLRSEKR